jgi:hypothetical protein
MLPPDHGTTTLFPDDGAWPPDDYSYPLTTTLHP